MAKAAAGTAAGTTAPVNGHGHGHGYGFTATATTTATDSDTGPATDADTGPATDADTGYSESKSPKMTQPLEILVVSDATGATAEAVVTSTLVQFSRANIRVRRFPFTRTVEQVREIVETDDCNRIFRSIAGIRTVDVTNRSIEETSDWITHNVL